MKKLPPLVIVVIATLIFLPFIFNSVPLIERNNDLYHHFFPFWFFFIRAIKEFGKVPLWQDVVMVGSPFLGDPTQSIFFYPFTYFSLIFSFPTFVIIFFLFHLSLSGIGVYTLARYHFNFPLSSAFLAAIVYMFSLQMFGRIEAGHIGMIGALSYVPFLLFAGVRIVGKSWFYWSLVLALSASFIYLNHLPILLFLGPVLAGWIIFFNRIKKKSFLEITWRAGFTALIFLSLTAFHLFALIELLPHTTRMMLIEENGLNTWAWRGFFAALFFPFLSGLNLLHEEAMLFLGFTPLTLAFYGFLGISKRYKTLLAVSAGIVVLFVLGEKTPFYSTMRFFLPLVSLLRVPSKAWFLVNLMTALLAGWGLRNFTRRFGNPIFSTIIIGLVFLELILVGFWRLKRPTFPVSIPSDQKLLYQTVGNEKGYFRLYCPTLCLSQTEIARIGKSLVGGYNPVQLASFANFLQHLGNYRFSSYTAFLPPYQIFEQKPQPDAQSLGLLATRYIVSPYALEESGLILERPLGNLFIYRNVKERPRVYWTDGEKDVAIKDAHFSPNQITIPIKGFSAGKVVISEVYYPAWRARLADGESLPILKERDIIMAVYLPNKEAENLVVYYQPFGAPWTFMVSITTFLIILSLFVYKAIRIIRDIGDRKKKYR